jgi:hypothetical protein
MLYNPDINFETIESIIKLYIIYPISYTVFSLISYIMVALVIVKSITGRMIIDNVFKVLYYIQCISLFYNLSSKADFSYVLFFLPLIFAFIYLCINSTGQKLQTDLTEILGFYITCCITYCVSDFIGFAGIWNFIFYWFIETFTEYVLVVYIVGAYFVYAEKIIENIENKDYKYFQRYKTKRTQIVTMALNKFSSILMLIGITGLIYLVHCFVEYYNGKGHVLNLLFKFAYGVPGSICLCYPGKKVQQGIKKKRVLNLISLVFSIQVILYFY